MSPKYLRTIGLITAATAWIFTGCASVNPDLDRARAAYEAAASDPALASASSVELYDAQKTLSAAQTAWEIRRDAEEVQHLAYVTERKLEIARTAAERKAADAQIAEFTHERERFVLENRTREAELARARAETAQTLAERARLEAEASQARAEAARLEAEEARARARSLEQQLAEVGARPTDRGHVLTLGDVLFDFNHAELKPGAGRNLERLVEFLNDNPERRVLIEGHTDSSGDDEYNRELSERRANSVRAFLRREQVGSDRIEVRGLGEDLPVASNETAAGRQQNRRVEVIILKPGDSE